MKRNIIFSILFTYIFWGCSGSSSSHGDEHEHQHSDHIEVHDHNHDEHEGHDHEAEEHSDEIILKKSRGRSHRFNDQDYPSRKISRRYFLLGNFIGCAGR